MTSTRTLTILVGGTILTLDGVKTVKNKQVKVDLKGNMVVDVMRHLTINANTIMTGEANQTTLKTNDALLENQTFFIRDLEVQMEQLASVFTRRMRGSLPSKIETFNQDEGYDKDRREAMVLRSRRPLMICESNQE
ncbi:uncharacterized protein E5676_scaffold1623G00220 [Cucumis melo var. makuwa]|uniref:Uncharacterized protein n=1 Tax=Cucumis melo var. makuwa TaxID=1194695 RepID=A0A5D3CUM3_CUCMM|nr:uncharacterized protein E5676_scaffold1623G00220 [Cucumis melo var. makuwa]